MVVDSNDGEFLSLLDEIFRYFDKLCIKNDVQKIETVGPIYMVTFPDISLRQLIALYVCYWFVLLIADLIILVPIIFYF